MLLDSVLEIMVLSRPGSSTKIVLDSLEPTEVVSAAEIATVANDTDSVPEILVVSLVLNAPAANELVSEDPISVESETDIETLVDPLSVEEISVVSDPDTCSVPENCRSETSVEEISVSSDTETYTRTVLISEEPISVVSDP